MPEGNQTHERNFSNLDRQLPETQRLYVVFRVFLHDMRRTLRRQLLQEKTNNHKSTQRLTHNFAAGTFRNLQAL